MTIKQHVLSLDQPFQQQCAQWLLERSEDVSTGMAGMLVLLPSARAGANLQHVLLDQSGRDALLLPEITTPERLARSLAERCGMLPESPLPPDLRATILARQLEDSPWLHTHSGSAPGVAEDLLTLFDEARLHGLTGLLTDEPGETARDLLTLEDAGAEELFARDLEQVRDAWCRYRKVVERDDIDILCDLAALLNGDSPTGAWPGPDFDLVVVAGFSEINPTVASLIRAVANTAESHLLLAGTEDRLSQLFLVSYGDSRVETQPLTPGRRLFQALAGEDFDTEQAHNPARSYHQRLVELGDTSDMLGPTGRLKLLACGDPERESVTVTGRVIEKLQAGAQPVRVAVATSDKALAARIVAQLHDAGIEADNSGGRSLSATPVGQLIQDLLRCVVTGFRYTQLLEVLTHPYVNVHRSAEQHAAWTSRLEKKIRDSRSSQGGMSALKQLAGEYDKAAVSVLGPLSGMDMTGFVHSIERAFKPLTSRVGRRDNTWNELLTALREVWQALASDHPLDVDGHCDNDQERLELVKLLADLENLAGTLPKALPPTSVADFMTELIQLLTRREVRPHRSAFLPVQVLGWLEARLEYYDLLIVAGMSEDVFPGRITRSLFLSDRVRRGLGLPGWRENVARQSELFLRLIHNGRQVVVTWPTEKLGQPCLASPLVIRLGLAHPDPFESPPAPPLYRKHEPDLTGIDKAQKGFAGEPTRIPAGDSARRAKRMSFSALKTFQQCQYRFLLERGYGLKESEKVLVEFRAMEYGQQAHRCLQRFLKPESAGLKAVQAGDRALACRLLDEQITSAFAASASDLPLRGVWGETLRRAVPAIVEFEIGRAREWTPWLLETPFTLTLKELRDWCVRACGDEEYRDVPKLPDVSDIPDIPEDRLDYPLDGVIDRVDHLNTDSAALAVIDYKTGSVPTPRQVETGEELQIILYALAVESGQLTKSELPAATRLSVQQGAYYGTDPENVGFSSARTHLLPTCDAGRSALVHGAFTILQTVCRTLETGQPFALIPEFWTGDAKGPLPCRYCPFLAVCRLEERQLPPHIENKLRQMISANRNG